MSDASESLRIKVDSTADDIVLTLSGEVAFRNAPALLTRVQQLANSMPKHLIVDLSAVEYIDSSGVGTLVQARRLFDQRGGRFAIVGLQPRVRGVFEITNLDRFFRLYETIAEARRA